MSSESTRKCVINVRYQVISIFAMSSPILHIESVTD